jgi:trypsin-like peptidase
VTPTLDAHFCRPAISAARGPETSQLATSALEECSHYGQSTCRGCNGRLKGGGRGRPSTVDRGCARLRLRNHASSQDREGGGKKNAPNIQYGVSFVGTGWCISTDRYLITAQHVLNEGKARDLKDKYLAFTVPGNGDAAHHFPVVGFVVEDQSNDIAILEVGPPAMAGQHIAPLAVTLARPPDGTPVLSYGFPSPVIAAANVDNAGNWAGGQFFLKSHANEGIVAGQYEIGGQWFFEFNVGWHHGESGGPVFQHDPLAAFAVMQEYRTIQTPNGVVAGPHRGRALNAVHQALADCGAALV